MSDIRIVEPQTVSRSLRYAATPNTISQLRYSGGPVTAVSQLRYSSGSLGTAGQAQFSNVLAQSVTANSGSGTTITTSFDDIFARASEKYGVPENLLKAIAKAESNFNPNAVSRSGAQGVMQLMPGTAAGLGVTDAFDPEQNIMGGAKYISQMLKQFNGDISLALAGYNAGPGAVKKYGGIPPYQETQNYVKTVQKYMGQEITAPSTVLQVGGRSTGANGVASSFDELLTELKSRQSMAVLTKYMTQVEEANKNSSKHTVPL